ncbi:M1 family metallopeptidase [Salinibacter grassmerensis]|uniref:M1 family metallopeptidase n=1 Tax=Salinibacter grassmerensis TaxID=3040353 RepID=UPI0021E79829|nr:M1 family metallopeptidase [Salinibacter grassmerensis]
MAYRRTARFLTLLLLFAGLGGCSPTSAQDSGGPLLPEQAAYDVFHYDLDVTVDPGRKRIEGTVDVRAVVEEPLEVLVLNLDRRLSVRQAWEIRERDTRRSVERKDGRNELWIDLSRLYAPGDTLHARVAYEGRPRVAPNPPWDGGLTWEETSTGAPWIATSCQTEGADLWWPVKDHPSDEPDSMDIAFTVPDSLTAASNGHLCSVEQASDSTETYRWHVSTPINTYNVALNAAPYVRLDTTYASTSGDAVPVSAYVLPSDSARGARALPDFLNQVQFLEETLGPYPPRADKYGVAQAPFLGMEHQSLIAYGHDFGDGGLGYEAPFDALHFHELAHEWYGNLVTVRDWKDFWLHEGPATYLEALYAEHLEGDRAYHDVTDYFRERVAGRTVIAQTEATTAESIYHRDVYFRGAMLLHTLRYMVGEDAVRTLLRRFAYPEGTGGAGEASFRQVTTRDFIETAEAVTDRSLNAFFEVYLYQASLPVLQTERSDGTLTLKWTNTGDVSFEVPVPVRVQDSTRRVAMTGGEAQVPIPAGADVQVDPKGWILKRR